MLKHLKYNLISKKYKDVLISLILFKIKKNLNLLSSQYYYGAYQVSKTKKHFIFTI